MNFYSKLIAVLTISSISFAATAKSNFGVINNGTLSKSRIVQNLEANIRSKVEPAIKELKLKSEAIKTKVDILERDKASLSAADKKSMEATIDNLQKEFEEFSEKMNQESGQYSNEINKKFAIQLSESVSKIAKKENLELVLSSQTLAYFEPALDITDKVINALEKSPDYAAK